MHKSQGNVLFLILIAVALFAALSYAVTNSSRISGNKPVSKETVDLQVSQILTYGQAVSGAILRMKMNGCDDTQISFSNLIVAGYSNSFSPSSKKCHVFDPNGGNISFLKMSPDFFDQDYAAIADFGQWVFTGRLCYMGVGSGDTSCADSNAELSMILIGVTDELCNAIQDKFNVTSMVISGTGKTKFTGVYGTNPIGYGTLFAKPIFCYGYSGQKYIVYTVLER